MTRIGVLFLLLGVFPLRSGAVPVTGVIDSDRVIHYNGFISTFNLPGSYALAKTADSLLIGGFVPAGPFSGTVLNYLAIGYGGLALHIDYATGTPQFLLETAGSSTLQLLTDGTYALSDGGFFQISGDRAAWRPTNGEWLDTALGDAGPTATFTKDSADESRGLFDREVELGQVEFRPGITEITSSGPASPLMPITLAASAFNVFPGLPLATDSLLFQWDLDADGIFDAFGDSIETSFDRGSHQVRLRVTNNYEFYSEASLTIEVPEPETLTLFLAGLLPLLWRARRANGADRAS